MANGRPYAVCASQIADIAAREPEPGEDLQDRNQRHLDWHHQQRHNRQEDPVATGELHPGEGIGGEGGHEYRDDRAGDGDDQAVDEGLAHVLRAAEHPGSSAMVKCQGGTRPVPPAEDCGWRRGAERADEQAERGHRPEQRDRPRRRTSRRRHCSRGVSAARAARAVGRGARARALGLCWSGHIGVISAGDGWILAYALIAAPPVRGIGGC